jgi:hypothetical protein
MPRVTKKKAETHLGKPCPTCGGTERYVSNKKCVSCTKKTNAAVYENRLTGNPLTPAGEKANETKQQKKAETWAKVEAEVAESVTAFHAVLKEKRPDLLVATAPKTPCRGCGEPSEALYCPDCQLDNPSLSIRPEKVPQEGDEAPPSHDAVPLILDGDVSNSELGLPPEAPAGPLSRYELGLYFKALVQGEQYRKLMAEFNAKVYAFNSRNSQNKANRKKGKPTLPDLPWPTKPIKTHDGIYLPGNVRLPDPELPEDMTYEQLAELVEKLELLSHSRVTAAADAFPAKRRRS